MDTDIIIPIYNAFDFTKKCIETVIEHTDLTKHTLLLINDKSTDQRILPLLTLFTTEYPSLNITIINNESNQGFVRTVNIGMQHSSRDVVLLNSDTEVTKNWLPKIQKCAYSKAAIATVTPLSNNATLASVPDFMSENTIPSDFTIEEYAEIVERCGRRCNRRYSCLCLHSKGVWCLEIHSQSGGSCRNDLPKWYGERLSGSCY